MQIPLLDLKEQLLPLREEILAAISDVVDSTTYILGPKVEELERNVAAYCGSSFGVGMSSGTDALLASLMALDIGPGDLVLTTPYSFFATMGCIVRLGARPVFADIDPVTFNISPDRIEEIVAGDPVLAGKIKAVLPVHLYGQCADMDRILPLAKRLGAPVIEDAAQAIGSCCPVRENGSLRWLRAGAMGKAGCFSFFPSKNLGGIGDGGLVTCNDEDFYERLKIFRMHGSAPKYHHRFVGGNFRLDPVQAVVLTIKLRHLPEWHAARRENALLYDELFHAHGLVDDGFVVPPRTVYSELAEEAGAPADHHIFNQYVIRAKNRDGLVRHLQSRQVGVEIYYPIPLHKQECVATLGYNALSFPESEKASAETLALPIYPELTDAMQEYVVDQIKAFYRE